MSEVTMLELLDGAPFNFTIQDAMSKCLQQVRNHEKIMVAISGGSDSDVMMDMIIRCGGKEKTTFVFFDTGLEYDATKRHLKYLEGKYGVKIEVIKPLIPIPICCRKYGVPFWSKRVSEYIYRLQKHGFKWEDRPFEELYSEYPNCKAALKWWCNKWPKKKNGTDSSFNIAYTPYLKEHMVAHPPTFAISKKCCEKAKHGPADKYEATHDFDLNCTGVRKAEGGTRATGFTTCFTRTLAGANTYRPLFWMSNADKLEYKAYYGVVNSDCYEIWGLPRTGCCGCPFGKDFEKELELMQQYEPKFYKAAVNVFGESYEYTRGYLQFREERKALERSCQVCVNIRE
jgi:3'-phosphoadenosine 5'-phosphosulfate sulfotransferase (PAPS reductase)/FAD synthetase